MKLKIEQTNSAGSVIVSTEQKTLTIAPFDTGTGKVPLSIIEAEGDLIVGSGAGAAQRLASSGVDGDVLTVNTAVSGGWSVQSPSGGSIVDATPCNGRLTLETGVAVSTSNQTAKSTIYLTPFRGNIIGLYYSGWSRYTFSEKSIKISDTQTGTLTSGSPTVTGLPDTTQLAVGMGVSGTGIAGGTTIQSVDSGTQITLSANATASGAQSLTLVVPALKNFDLFAYYTGSDVKLKMVLWTNDSTRATALTTSNGLLVLTGDATMRYLGTGRTTAVAGQTEDSTSNRLIWNYYNRVSRPMTAIDTTNTWTYSTATWRQANANAANQLSFVIGVAEIIARARLSVVVTADAGRNGSVGIGVDATNANSATVFGPYQFTTNITTAFAEYAGMLAAGYHYLAWLEIGGSAGTITWYGDNGGTTVQSGLVGQIEG